MKYIYLVNRFNFKDKTDRLVERLKSASEKFKRDYEIIINDTPEEAKNACKQFKDTEYVITAIGGDGSINLVLNDIVDTNNILAYIPIGTGNDFYRASLEEFDNGIHTTDLIKINDRYFINVACFGIDADIANDDNFIHNNLIPQSMRYDAGVVYYFLTYKGRKLKIEYDNNTIEKDVTTVVVANSKYYGGGYKVAPNSKIDDGKMEVYIVDKLNKVKMASIILSMKNAGHLNNPALHTINTNKLTISSDHIFKANIDGEAIESDRFEIELIENRFRIDLNKEFIKEVIK